MSKAHPQNGLSFSRSTQKAKPFTDAELMRYHKWKGSQDDAARQRAAEAKALRTRPSLPDTFTVRGCWGE